MAIKSTPVSVDAAREFDRWAGKMIDGLRELVAAGEAPAAHRVDEIIDLAERLRTIVRTGADQAERAGQDRYVIEAPFTPVEQKLLTDVGTPLMSYLNILATRGKIDAIQNPEVEGVIAAMLAGATP